MKQWRDTNREHDKQRQKDWYNENRDYFVQKYQANRDVLLERKRQQRAANPGSDTENSRRWRREHPDQWALRNRENQNRRRANGSDRVDYAAILERHGMICHICRGAIPSLAVLHFDHVIPLAKGGRHTAENIRPSHALCNLRKSDKIL